MADRVQDRGIEKIPYDNFVVEAVVSELQPFVGGKIQGLRQPTESDVAVFLYGSGREGVLLLSCHAVFSRAHLIAKRPPNQPQPPAFVSALRAKIDGARIVDIRQVAGDRVIELVAGTAEGEYTLVAELMGKHSNLVLIDPKGRIAAAAKWVTSAKSSRQILPGIPFARPPVMTSAHQARSKFFERLVAAGAQPGVAGPVLSPGHGAYPISIAPLGFNEFPRASISVALENFFDVRIPEFEAEHLRTSLMTQLGRVLLAREVALSDLRQTEQTGAKAAEWQRLGELILAYGSTILPKSTELLAWDYDGSELTVELNPELNFKENANAHFERAKKAKGRMGMVRDQIERLSEDRKRLIGLLERVEAAFRLSELVAWEEQARRAKYLNTPQIVARTKQERPFEGHRIREYIGPSGYPVLFGETAEANDYLTLRVAKPNDIWMHIRGGTSAHVIIRTQNQPERVQPDVLMYAAKIAVQHSKSKHSGFVPVDYTLKKYVRKPKGAATGAASYTNEKTLHVES